MKWGLQAPHQRNPSLALFVFVGVLLLFWLLFWFCCFDVFFGFVAAEPLDQQTNKKE